MHTTVHHSTLPSYTYGCQNIVTRHHNGSNIGRQKLLDHARGCWLQFVLENDESNKFKAILNVGSSHLLCFKPAEFLEVPRCTSDDSIALVGVV